MLSTGGVSVGQFDHVKGALDELGMRQLFHGVAQKPGRPLKFGTVGYRPIFGLPGNPVSTLVCFYLYARPALLKMSGHRRVGLPRVNARCAVDIKIGKRSHRVRASQSRARGEGWLATPTGSQGSGILSSLSRADGAADRPVNRDAVEGGRSGYGIASGRDRRNGRVTDDEALFEAPEP